MPRPMHRHFEDDTLSQRLAAAFLISLLAHTAFFGIIQIGNQLHWWDSSPFSIFRKTRLTPEDVARLKEQQRQLQQQAADKREQELIFVQVTTPDEEPPEATPYYSAASSRASNPEPGDSSRVAIDGKQTKILRTEDVPRVIAEPRPTPPPPDLRTELTPAPKPPPAETLSSPQVVQAEMPVVAEKPAEPERQPGIGDLALLQPELASKPPPRDLAPPPSASTRPETPTVTEPPRPVTPAQPQPRPRPRTVAEAKLQQALLAGEKMKQEGGVPRRGDVQLDVVGKPFGAYDQAVVLAVQNRWYTLIEQSRVAGGSGRVIINFRLYSDGKVSIVEPTESEVDAFLESLCVRAVRDPSPYEPWPPAMLREVGRNYREIRFTFLYD